jgi:hypothetical protein
MVDGVDYNWPTDEQRRYAFTHGCQRCGNSTYQEEVKVDCFNQRIKYTCTCMSCRGNYWKEFDDGAV